MKEICKVKMRYVIYDNIIRKIFKKNRTYVRLIYKKYNTCHNLSINSNVLNKDVDHLSCLPILTTKVKSISLYVKIQYPKARELLSYINNV